MHMQHGVINTGFHRYRKCNIVFGFLTKEAHKEFGTLVRLRMNLYSFTERVRLLEIRPLFNRLQKHHVALPTKVLRTIY